MELEVDQSALSRVLSVVNASVSGVGEGAVEIVKFVLFECYPDRIDFTVTNKKSTVFMSTPAQCSEETSMCVPHKQLNSLIKLLDAKVSMKEVRGRLLITQGSTKLKIPVRPGVDYPSREILDVTEGSLVGRIRVSSSSLVTALQMASKALGKTDSGAWLLKALEIRVSSNDLHLYSCDGHQISRISLPTLEVSSEEIPPVLLPDIAISGIRAFLKSSKDEEVDLGIYSNKLTLETDLGKLVVVTAQGKFPDIGSVIEGEREFSFEIPTETLSIALQRALFFSPNNGYCEITLSDTSITIRAKDPSLGESVESLDIECPELKDKGFEIALNGSHLLSALTQTGSITRIQLSFAHRVPLFIESEVEDVKFKYLLMRMLHKGDKQS